MTVPEALRTVRYVIDSEGRKTDAVVPMAAFRTLVETWQKALAQLEDREDRAILQDWLERRAAGESEMISLEQLEQELMADGLLERSSGRSCGLSSRELSQTRCFCPQ